MSVVDFLEPGSKNVALKAAASAAVYAGASYGFGYVAGRWPTKARVDLFVGGGLFLLALGGDLAGSDLRGFAPRVKMVSNAGLGCFAHWRGAKSWWQSQGKELIAVPRQATLPVQATLPPTQPSGSPTQVLGRRSK